MCMLALSYLLRCCFSEHYRQATVRRWLEGAEPIVQFIQVTRVMECANFTLLSFFCMMDYLEVWTMFFVDAQRGVYDHILYLVSFSRCK